MVWEPCSCGCIVLCTVSVALGHAVDALLHTNVDHRHALVALVTTFALTTVKHTKTQTTQACNQTMSSKLHRDRWQ